MKVYFSIAGREFPTYGFCIALGVLVANLIAVYLVKKNKDNIEDLFILEAYAMLGGFFGAKLLYLLVSWKQIEWSRIFEIDYFNQLMLGGFVFYGGLIGGVIFVVLFGRLHNIDAYKYINNYIFLIPLIHGFGRIGCFFAGCCYGRPYNGIGAVIFPEDSMGLSGVSLFPIQIVEAICLFLISMIIVFFYEKIMGLNAVGCYFVLYGGIRLILEKYRYDTYRGIYFGISISQWISIVLIIVGNVLVFWYLMKYNKEKNRIMEE